MRIRTLCPLLFVLAAPLAAQEQERPAGWMTRLDRAGTSGDVLFVTMTPGWHVTTGPAGILYHPDSTATGRFRLESEVFLFPTNGRDREAFGIIFGGRELDGPNQAYSYFLLRNTGDFIIKRRQGAEAPTVQAWTSSSAVTRQEGEGTAKNVLAIEAGDAQVEFFINGERVAMVPRADLSVDGIVGLRVNHSLNLHVSTLTVTPR